MIRASIFAVAVAALLPLQGAALVAQAPAAEAAARFDPPGGSLVLTRTVWRTLYDGKQVVAKRSYLVRFEPDDGGFAIEGQLIASEIEAPQALEPIARIERERRDDGLFPIRLDRSGRIRSRASSGGPAIDRGIASGQAILDSAQLAAQERQIAEDFVGRLAASGVPADWPADLFNPAAPARTASQVVTLPDGSTGRVTVSMRAEPGGPGALPSAVEREVVTELEGSQRTTRERWTIVPQAGPHG